jgi:glycosyltransferase involved in cell wall biosynthesis
MNKLNVLICAPLPPPKGGIATWVYEVVEASKYDNKINIDIFNTANKRKAGVYSNLRRIVDGLSLFIFQAIGFNKKIKNKNIDIVHLASSGGFAHFRDVFFSLLAKLYGKKVILQLHYGVNDVDYQWAPFSRFFLFICKKIVDKILTLDPSYEKSNSSSKVFLSFNGMSEKIILKPVVKENIIVFVGWIIEQKGIFELVAAWNSLKEKNNWKLIIIGPSQKNEREMLLDLIDSSNTEYLGELSRELVLSYTNKCSVFALPSHTEGFPYAVLEAMQSRLAILVSNVGGMPQLFQFEKKPGWLIDPKDMLSLSHALHEIIHKESPVKVYSENSYELFTKNYTNLHMINNLIQHWQKT